MPVHALLGATGGTGTAILRFLRKAQPDLQLNVLVRNRKKLLDAFPDLETSAAFGHLQVRIIEAGLDNQESVKEALAYAEVIYSCIASNESTHGMSIAADTAKVIIRALDALKEEERSSYSPPTILMLRSANLSEPFSGKDPLDQSWNPVIMALRYLYADLAVASKLYEGIVARDPRLLRFVFVDPVAIHDPSGTECTGYELLVETKPKSMSISYADLGEAFTEIARRRKEFEGGFVMIAGTGKVNEEWPSLLGHIAQGAIERVKHVV